MRKTRAIVRVGRAVVLIAALLFVGVAAGSFHSHEGDDNPSCSTCAFAKTPVDSPPTITVETRLADAGAVCATSWLLDGPHQRASVGSRAPPATL
jgi:hypothetical protein